MLQGLPKAQTFLNGNLGINFSNMGYQGYQILKINVTWKQVAKAQLHRLPKAQTLKNGSVGLKFQLPGLPKLPKVTNYCSLALCCSIIVTMVTKSTNIFKW